MGGGQLHQGAIEQLPRHHRLAGLRHGPVRRIGADLPHPAVEHDLFLNWKAANQIEVVGHEPVGMHVADMTPCAFREAVQAVAQVFFCERTSRTVVAARMMRCWMQAQHAIAMAPLQHQYDP